MEEWQPQVHTGTHKFHPCLNMGIFQTFVSFHDQVCLKEDTHSTPLPT